MPGAVVGAVVAAVASNLAAGFLIANTALYLGQIAVLSKVIGGVVGVAVPSTLPRKRH